jgi:integrase
MSKPRISYSEFVATQMMKLKEHSVAYAIQWRLTEMRKPGARQFGESLRFTLARMQSEEIGTKVLPEMKPQDLIDHCRWRIAGGVKPATVNSDMTALRSTLTDYVESNDLPHEWLLVFAKVRRKLQKDQLVGKAEQRTRLPLLEELALFRSHYEMQNKHPRCKTNMVRVLDGLVLLGRRIGELCRIERQHINVAKKTYIVYDLKNSKGKGHHGEAALIEGAWELVVSILAVIPNEPTARLFPYCSRTCSQRQTLAKKKLQKEHPHLFQNLHMHDQRAYCFTELLKKGYSALQVKRVSLHATTKMIDTVYGRLTAADVVQGPLGQPMQLPAMRTP